jgi:hypothetical protein
MAEGASRRSVDVGGRCDDRRMSEFTHYAQGTPCWIDLATDDLAAASAFYRAVFGWEFDEPATDRDSYTTVRLRGKAVAGIFVPGRAGIPVVWTTYLAADDVDIAAKTIAEHGGQLLTPVMDVPGDGRMVVAADPAGAVFGVWQASPGSPGVQLANEPGTLIWNELLTTDTATARAFYGEVFGFAHSDPFDGEQDYTGINIGGVNVGGIGVVGGDGPAHWSVYFGVADTDAAADAVRAAGGRVDREPVDTPYGRMATCSDPRGGRFTLLNVSAD